MDVDLVLHEIRELAGEVLAIEGDPDRPLLAVARKAELADKIAEKFDALDQWMSKGGFTPSAWAHAETEDHRS